MVRSSRIGVVALLAIAAVACGESSNDDGGSLGVGGAGGAGGAGGTGGGGPVAPPVGYLLGDGTAESVEFKVIADESDNLQVPRDLDFHPAREGELWIVNRADDSTTIVLDAATTADESMHLVDGYAMHFMEEVSSIAFGARNYRDDYTFGTCQESRNTYNGQALEDYFMGPALWTSDFEVYAVADPIGLGSHLDMLHESPDCMGIAHDRDNVYWAFDGYNGSIVRYDFQDDHDAGYDDHSDGIIRFLNEPRVLRVEDVPSHMEIDHEGGLLYVADTGNARVLRIEIAGGEKLGNRSPTEPGTTVEDWTTSGWDELVPASSGLLQHPSGLALHQGTLYIGDNATGTIFAFDLEGELVTQLDTGLEPGALMGLEAGPDDRLYFVDAIGNRVLRIEVLADQE